MSVSTKTDEKASNGQQGHLGYPECTPVSLVGTATSIIFVMTKHIFCHDRSMFVMTKHAFVMTNTILSCRGKHNFVVTKDVFCCDKHMFIMTKVLLSRLKSYLWQLLPMILLSVTFQHPSCILCHTWLHH